jgi:esterase/lipase superfamily enzyme
VSHAYYLTARAIRRGAFIAEPGPSKYLKVPLGEVPTPAHAIARQRWVAEVRAAATWGSDDRDATRDRGDVLVFVHGYNNGLDDIAARHAQLSRDLDRIGWKGAVVTFAWPCDDLALNYLEDRHDAKRSAMQLVTDGIALLATPRRPLCSINVHLLGHSTGAFVIREAFDDADDAMLQNSGWSVSQVAFVAADVSANSLSASHAKSTSLFRHCARLTNYFSRHDGVLKLSNTKRVGVAPRVGRVGLPADAPTKAADVDCSEYFALLDTDAAVRAADQVDSGGRFDHSWYLGNALFLRDLFETLKGELDRTVVPTRVSDTQGTLRLQR